MPVSHLGLTVSHLPSAASFYLSALQPLGYRFIGSQGDSIGLGIQDADFFITQGPRSLVITPTHIAFAADDRTQVRECYASALGAGGRPSGSPSYRNSSCSCFNSAVEDLDGNTIEFIFRENGPCEEEPAHAASEHSRVLTWQEGVSREAADGVPQDDAASVASKAQSRARTALDLASSTAKSTKDAGETPASGAEGAMSALANGISPKAILGGVIGAAAAGAIAYAFYQSEQDSARKEEAHEALMASYERGRPMSGRAQTTQLPSKAPTHAPTQAPSRAPTAMKRSLSAAPPRSSRFHRNYSTTESVAPHPRTHRNFSVTESRVGPRPPPTKTPTQAPTALKAIEARAFDNDSEIQDAMSKFTSRKTQVGEDSKPQDAISRFTARRPQIDNDSEVQAAVSRNTTINRRPQVTRSQTFDATSVYAPVSSAGGRSRSRGVPQRSATLADEPSRHSQLFLEGPKELVPSHSSLRSNRDDDASLRRHDSGASVLSRRSSKVSKMPGEERRSSASHVNAAKAAKEGSKYEGSRLESRHEGSKHEGSRYEDSRHEGSRHEGSNHAASRHGSLRDPDALSDASTIKASRRDSAAHIQSPGSKANSKVASRAEYRLPDSPVPSYYAPPSEQPRSSSRAPSQMTAVRMPLPPSRAPSHVSAAQPPIAPSRRGSQVSAAQPSLAMHRRASIASGSVAGIPLPNSLASGRGYEDVYDSDGMGDMKTVIPDDSISCIEPNVLKSARSDVSKHSERSHRSHRSHHSSRSKHTHRHEDEGERDPGDAKTVVPDDSISSVGSKQARSEHSHRSHRDQKSHHSSRSKQSKSHDHEGEKEEAPLDVRSHHSSRSKRSQRPEEAAEREPGYAKTIVPEDSISSVGAPARSVHSHHSSRSKHSKSNDAEKEKEEAPLDARSHHSSRSKRSHRHEESGERDPGDTKTIVPGDSISSVGAPARSEHSHHSRRSERDGKSHHSSRSSKKHGEDKDKKSSKEGRTVSESGKSDSTVKPAKSKVSAMTLPGRLFGKDDKEKSKKSDKRSVASHA